DVESNEREVEKGVSGVTIVAIVRPAWKSLLRTSCREPQRGGIRERETSLELAQEPIKAHRSYLYGVPLLALV
ncbi:MAG: hypothetical protein M3003_16965, partial [Candidatus Dormibacteraeota bacterium]|nr:hypothetical protein [Candidatus Dormibacteraeota bacterium]